MKLLHNAAGCAEPSLIQECVSIEKASLCSSIHLGVLLQSSSRGILPHQLQCHAKSNGFLVFRSERGTNCFDHLVNFLCKQTNNTINQEKCSLPAESEGTASQDHGQVPPRSPQESTIHSNDTPDPAAGGRPRSGEESKSRLGQLVQQSASHTGELAYRTCQLDSLQSSCYSSNSTTRFVRDRGTACPCIIVVVPCRLGTCSTTSGLGARHWTSSK